MKARVAALVCLAASSCLVWPAQATTVTDIQQRVGLDQHLGRELPLDVRLRDEYGTQVELGELLGSRPAVIAPVYFECPNLCTLTLNGLLLSLRSIDLTAGRDFEVIAVSFDPREGAALAHAKRDAYLERYGRPSACLSCTRGWHFLTGDAPQVAALLGALGFRYFWDQKLRQYAHAAAIVVVTPRGRIAQYFNGVSYPPAQLRAALLGAAAEHSGSLAERLWLLCYHYESLAGPYSALIASLLRLLGLATVLALILLVARLVRNSP
ncbi:MAG TPA: SCO family protein [Steroidobacteraceae bacterium]|jgi:protein SCO1/2|nr:SCO family protein [Steroidobacteraceae bacterium]